eukprot:Rmarinus@m.28751
MVRQKRQRGCLVCQSAYVVCARTRLCLFGSTTSAGCQRRAPQFHLRLGLRPTRQSFRRCRTHRRGCSKSSSVCPYSTFRTSERSRCCGRGLRRRLSSGSAWAHSFPKWDTTKTAFRGGGGWSCFLSPTALGQRRSFASLTWKCSLPTTISCGQEHCPRARFSLDGKSLRLFCCSSGQCCSLSSSTLSLRPQWRTIASFAGSWASSSCCGLAPLPPGVQPPSHITTSLQLSLTRFGRHCAICLLGLSRRSRAPRMAGTTAFTISILFGTLLRTWDTTSSVTKSLSARITMVLFLW